MRRGYAALDLLVTFMVPSNSKARIRHMFPDLLVTLLFKECLVYINIIAQGSPFYVGC